MSSFESDFEGHILHRLVEARAESAPEVPLILDADGEHTGAWVNGEANRIARALIANGIQPGDSCAVMMENSVAYVAAWIGIAKAGAVEVPINTAYHGEILRHVLKTAECALVILDAEFLPVLGAVLPDCPAVRLCLVRGGSGAQPAGFASTVVDFDESLGKDRSNPDLAVGFADPAAILFTSGTTGPSKGAIISHRQMIGFGETYAAITSMTAEDTCYNYLPLFHAAGKFNFMAPLIAGGRMVLRPRLSVSQFWDDIRRYLCTVTTAVGGVCNMLYGQAQTAQDADNSLRLVYAVPIPHEIKTAFENRFRLVLIEGYGSTECNIVCWTPPKGAPRGACGRPSPWYEVRIVDAYDRELPAGEAGEIAVRGRGPYLLTQGYYGMPEATNEVFRNQWFHTGDRGRFDAEGWLYFIDRMKDAIRRRGENISSYEVEQVVLRHPEIAEAAAVGVRSELQEEELKLVVVRRAGAGLTEAELLQWCAEEMPYFMVPRYLELRAELPRTPTQKIRKVELRTEGIGPNAWDSLAHGFRMTRTGLRKSGDDRL